MSSRDGSAGGSVSTLAVEFEPCYQALSFGLCLLACDAAHQAAGEPVRGRGVNEPGRTAVPGSAEREAIGHKDREGGDQIREVTKYPVKHVSY